MTLPLSIDSFGASHSFTFCLSLTDEAGLQNALYAPIIGKLSAVRSINAIQIDSITLKNGA